jgi:hypothetical protein
MNEISPKEVSALHGRITQELNKVIVGSALVLGVGLFAICYNLWPSQIPARAA